MNTNKDLFTRKFLFVLACCAVIIDISAVIYAIYTHDLGVIIVLIVFVLPSIVTIYRGLTDLKK